MSRGSANALEKAEAKARFSKKRERKKNERPATERRKKNDADPIRARRSEHSRAMPALFLQLERVELCLSRALGFEWKEIAAVGQLALTKSKTLSPSEIFSSSGRRLGVVRNRAAEQVLRVHLQDSPQADEDYQRESERTMLRAGSQPGRGGGKEKRRRRAIKESNESSGRAAAARPPLSPRAPVDLFSFFSSLHPHENQNQNRNNKQIGNVKVGSEHPVRLQTMTTTGA